VVNIGKAVLTIVQGILLEGSEVCRELLIGAVDWEGVFRKSLPGVA
jgi:hypothetical protein